MKVATVSVRKINVSRKTMSHIRKDYYTKAIPPCKNLIPFDIGEYLRVKCVKKTEKNVFRRKMKFEKRFCVIKNESFYMFKDEEGKSEDPETKSVDLRNVYDLNLIQKFERRSLPDEKMTVFYLEKICILKLKYDRKSNAIKYLELILDGKSDGSRWVSIILQVFEKDNLLNEKYLWCNESVKQENMKDLSQEADEQVQQEPLESQKSVQRPMTSVKECDDFKNWLEYRGKVSSTYRQNLEKCSELLLKIVTNHELEYKSASSTCETTSPVQDSIVASNCSPICKKLQEKNSSHNSSNLERKSRSSSDSSHSKRLQKIGKFSSQRPSVYVKSMQKFFESKMERINSTKKSTVLPSTRSSPTITTSSRPISTKANVKTECKTTFSNMR